MSGFTIGQEVSIIDDIDYNISTPGTIKFIEPDIEVEGLDWLYIRANDEMLNRQIDNRIGTYWRIIEFCSNKIVTK